MAGKFPLIGEMEGTDVLRYFSGKERKTDVGGGARSSTAKSLHLVTDVTDEMTDEVVLDQGHRLHREKNSIYPPQSCSWETRTWNWLPDTLDYY